MDQGLIPRRYAKALYEVGEERAANDTLYAIMGSLAKAFAGTPGLAATIANPFADKDDKTALLITAAYGAETDNVDPVFNDFLKLLNRNGRTDMACEIARAFVALYRREHAIYLVEIVSAAQMGDNERQRLQEIIRNHIGRGSFEFSYSVNPALIGGFTVTVNSERLDASVSSRLKELKLKLID